MQRMDIEGLDLPKRKNVLLNYKEDLNKKKIKFEEERILLNCHQNVKSVDRIYDLLFDSTG